MPKCSQPKFRAETLETFVPNAYFFLAKILSQNFWHEITFRRAGRCIDPESFLTAQRAGSKFSAQPDIKVYVSESQSTCRDMKKIICIQYQFFRHSHQLFTVKFLCTNVTTGSSCLGSKNYSYLRLQLLSIYLLLIKYNQQYINSNLWCIYKIIV